MLIDSHDANFTDSLPDTDYAVIANPRRFSNRRGHHWNDTRQPSAGAQEFAFVSLSLPEQSPIGAATAQLQQLALAEANLIYVYGVAVTSTGLGGVTAGNMNLQGLVDPNQPGS